MNEELKKELLLAQTDLTGALDRFARDETLYSACLSAFLNDDTMRELTAAVNEKRYTDSFNAAHALKGVSGNMGFIPLYHAAAKFVSLFRDGKTDELDSAFCEISACYKLLIRIIKKYCS